MTTWYHGTPISFEVFEASSLGRGNDELGTGFYFTDRLETAQGYARRNPPSGEPAPTVLVAELTLSKPVPEEGGITRRQIEAILRASPDFDDNLINFGDVDFEGKAKVVGAAVITYYSVASADTLRALYSIANDFYSGSEAQFLAVVRNVTGYDGLVRKVGGETHAVVWFPEQIKIVERLSVDETPGMRP